VIREDRELIAELARLNKAMAPLCMCIMDGSASTAELCSSGTCSTPELQGRGMGTRYRAQLHGFGIRLGRRVPNHVKCGACRGGDRTYVVFPPPVVPVLFTIYIPELLPVALMSIDRPVPALLITSARRLLVVSFWLIDRGIILRPDAAV
jgi:hypothetical protein